MIYFTSKAKWCTNVTDTLKLRRMLQKNHELLERERERDRNMHPSLHEKAMYKRSSTNLNILPSIMCNVFGLPEYASSGMSALCSTIWKGPKPPTLSDQTLASICGMEPPLLYGKVLSQCRASKIRLRFHLPHFNDALWYSFHPWRLHFIMKTKDRFSDSDWVHDKDYRVFVRHLF